jgi:hypothetical protein
MTVKSKRPNPNAKSLEFGVFWILNFVVWIFRRYRLSFPVMGTN